jgi:arylsulfatase A-like enzyme
VTADPLPGAMPSLLVIMLDSFRQDHVGASHAGRGVFPGTAPCRTPYFDRFAQQCVLFENAYPEPRV